MLFIVAVLVTLADPDVLLKIAEEDDENKPYVSSFIIILILL